jgi:hypothetical protein
MKDRLIILPIDSILALFKDYAGLIAIPDDAKVTKLLLNPQERKLAMEVESESWDGLQVPEEIRFDLQRTYLVN